MGTSTARRPARLDPRERAFVHVVTSDPALPGAEAARRAGYEGDPTALSSTASRLLRRPRVQRAISRRIAKRVAGTREVLGELSAIATAPWRDFIEVKTDDEGNVVSARLDLGHKVKAAEVVLKAQQAFTDPLTRALGKIAMLEVDRLLAARRKQARKRRLLREKRREERRTKGLLARGEVVEVEAHEVGEVEAAEEDDAARQDEQAGQVPAQPEVATAQPAQRPLTDIMSPSGLSSHINELRVPASSPLPRPRGPRPRTPR